MDVRVELDPVEIDRPIEDVFSFMTQMENSPAWGRTTTTEQISDGGISVGTRFREIAGGSGDGVVMETVITALDPPVGYAYTSRYENGIEERAQVSLVDLAGRTRVTPTAEVHLPDVPQDQEHVVVTVMRAEVKGILRNLKRHMEDDL